MNNMHAPGALTAPEFIPLCVPELRGNEWKFLKDCLDTGWVSSVGSYVERFERTIAESAGVKYAVATVNGTSALHIALLVAGVLPDDEVLVTALTFIAPVNAIRYVGAWPVFIDAERRYWQMNPGRVAEFLETQCAWRNGALCNKATGRKVTAIIPVHILGHPVDMNPILAAARKYKLRVIEDATEGLGAKYQGQSLGGLGDLGCFSFNGNKLITTGGGGMVVTNNEAWARRAKYLSTQAKDDEVEYVHNEIGYNYRLTNLQAALGCAQMEHLKDYVEVKRRIAARYAEAFKGLSGIESMAEAPWAFSTYWMFTVLLDEARFGMGSRQLLHYLQKNKISTRPLWQPIHQSPAHPGCRKDACPTAERLHACALSLPCSVGLAREAQERVIAHIREAATASTRPSGISLAGAIPGGAPVFTNS